MSHKIWRIGGGLLLPYVPQGTKRIKYVILTPFELSSPRLTFGLSTVTSYITFLYTSPVNATFSFNPQSSVT